MYKIRFVSHVNLSYVSNIGGDTVRLTTDVRKCQNLKMTGCGGPKAKPIA